jgi:pimeloyl-ACP methyl ester carboxylesterase
MARIAVNGTTLAYDDEGHGDPPFLFIHGFACDRSFWRPQCEDLSRDYRCVSVDLRGRGDSDATPPFDVTTAALDSAALIEAIALDRPIVVGHSLGGLVALRLNDLRPELVRAIVIGDSPLTAARSAGAFDDASRGIREAGSMEPMRNMVESFFVEATPHDIREHVRQVMLGCPPEVGAGMLANGAVFSERLDEMIKLADRRPFMAIWAERPLGDPKHLRDITMFVRQEPIAGAGHFFQLEQPEITNALLRAFVDDVERDPRSA